MPAILKRDFLPSFNKSNNFRFRCCFLNSIGGPKKKPMAITFEDLDPIFIQMLSLSF